MTGFGIPRPIKKEYEIELIKYGVPSPNTAGAKGNHPLRAETNSSIWSNENNRVCSTVRSRQRASGRGLAGKRKVCSARVSVCRRCRRCRHRSTSRGGGTSTRHSFISDTSEAGRPQPTRRPPRSDFSVGGWCHVAGRKGLGRLSDAPPPNPPVGGVG